MSIIYELENQERRDYISEWIKRELNINSNDSFNDYKQKIKDLLKSNPNDLTTNEYTLYNYIKGENNKDFLIKDTFKKIGNEIYNKKINELKETKIKFKKVENKNYEKAINKYVYGYVKNTKVQATPERYLIKGKEIIKFRDNKGRFVSIRKND